MAKLPVLVVGLLALAGATAGCSDPRLTVSVTYADPDLRAQLASLTVSVVQLEPQGGAPVTCDDVEFGAIDRATLDGGRRASASALAAGASLEGVPRLGDKLFVLDGRDRNGNRIAGGCTAHGDIAEDTPVEVVAELAPRIRLVGSDGVRDPTDEPRDFTVVLYRPWKVEGQTVGLPGREVRVDVRDRARDQRDYVTCATGQACITSGSDGVATIPLGTTRAKPGKGLESGPIETIVRASWVEEPLLVRSFARLTEVDTVTLVPGARGNQGEPSWVVRSEGARLQAAALHTSGTPSVYRLILVHNSVARPLDFEREELVVDEPVHALVAWDDGFWTLAASGWRHLDYERAILGPGDGTVGRAATELRAVQPCGDEAVAAKGLLSRTDDDDYVAWSRPGVRQPADGTPLASLVAQINGITGREVMALPCVTWPAGLRRTAVVRGGPTSATSLVNGTGKVPSPLASGFVGYQVGGQGPWRLAGAELTVTGPALRSFTLATPGTLLDDDGRLDGDLTSLPQSTSLGEIGGVPLAATAHELIGETRVQLTFLPDDGRAPLTGLSPPTRGLSPVVVLLQVPVNGVAVDLLAVANKEQLLVGSFAGPR